ncbi:putative phage abortive infection protein [Ectopseudomonas chengduensis]|nr:putative phage abortive infection protein [Pseudomonas chengduensis]UZT77039.1 putative phage abortive infection protein [Pseudomonas chengduensis]
MNTRLAYEFRKKILKEKIVRFFKYRYIITKETIEKINFTLILSLTSTLLITAVTSTLYYNFSKNSEPTAIPHAEELQYWGQIGDFIGGVLNPLLSFLALMAVLHTIKIQRHELKEAREEAKLANTIQNKQTEVFERQNFESVLFRLFDVHNKITDRILNTKKYSDSAFQKLLSSFKSELAELDNAEQPTINSGPSTSYFIWRQNEIDKIAKAAGATLSKQNQETLSHYFRNIYQILKIIDEQQFSGENTTTRIRDEYTFKRRYSSMFRALLTGDELKIIVVNCYTNNGSGLKKYIEKYSILKHLETYDFLDDRKMALDFFNEMAFLDSENISDAHISRFDFNKQRGTLSRTSRVFGIANE